MFEKKKILQRPLRQRANPFLIILCFLAAWLATGPFIDSIGLRLVLSVPCLLLLFRATIRWTNSRRLQFSREQFKWFLELLLARLSAGATLERSLSDTLPGLSQLLGHKSDLIRGLQQLDQQLTARQPLESLLPQFSRYLLCPESSVFFHVLPELRKTGGQLVQYVRQHVQMVSEQLSLQQDLNAETTQRQTEALILTLMPFVMAALLKQSSDQLTLASLGQPAGVIGRIFAFALAMLAAFMTLSSLGFNQDKKHRSHSICKTYSGIPQVLQRRICILFHHLYRDLLPDTYGARLLQILLEHAPSEDIPDQQILMGFFNQKMLYLLISFFPGLLILLVNPSDWYWLFLLPVLILILHDQKIFSLRRQKMTDYRLEYPVFLNLANALLQAGLSLHKTLHICLDSLQAEKKDPKTQATSLIKDLSNIRRLMLTGYPANQIIEQLAATCPLPEAQAALLLMLRYDQSGGFETLQLLSMQSSACWSLYRSTMRKQMEQQSLRLLLPMTLDLLAVLLTALLPAVMSLNTI